MNAPLCVSCDSNSLRSASEEGEKGCRKSQEKKPSRRSRALDTAALHDEPIELPVYSLVNILVPCIYHSSRPDYRETLN